MAVSDDLNRLATQDVVYLRRYTYGSGSTSAMEVYRGRLRQALNGEWVFNAFTGQNGVVGFILGGVMQNWNSGESPGSGIQVTITNTLLSGSPAFFEAISLLLVIPQDFTE